MIGPTTGGVSTDDVSTIIGSTAVTIAGTGSTAVVASTAAPV